MERCIWVAMVPWHLLLTSVVAVKGADTSSLVLARVAQAYWQWKIRQFPTIASFYNIPNMDDKLEDLSLQAADERQKYAEFLWQHLQRVNVQELSDDDNLTYDVLTSDLQHFMDGYKYRMYSYLNPINFLQSFHRRKSWIKYPSLTTIPSYHRFLKRLQALAVQVDQAITLMKEAVRLNRTNHRVSMRGIPEQLEAEIQVPDNETVYYQPFLTSVNLPADQWTAISNSALYIISQLIKPAYRRLRHFLLQVYLPATRASYGVGTMVGGPEYYQACLRFHLSANVTAAEIRHLGEQEVARIKIKMYDIIRNQGFHHSLSEFFAYIRQNRSVEFYNQTQVELLSGYRQIIKNVIPQRLPMVLRHSPGEEIQILPMPIDGPTGSYSNGIFYVNLHRAHTRPSFTMTALALHEANPGHHLQVEYSRQQHVPSFRRHLCCMQYNTVPLAFQWYSAYTEGWGLYAEYLGELMGVYNQSSLELLGRYSSEILRACRLVVDTGIHVYGWSRERAISYLVEHSAIPPVQAEVEVDRYISWPGQACAYKYGEITIQRLRTEAQSALGALFDIRDFNHQVLQAGRVPLHVLTKLIHRWVRRSLRSREVKVSHIRGHAPVVEVNLALLTAMVGGRVLS